MKILFCGDVMGRSGRDAVVQHLPTLKHKLQPDVIVVNGENSAAGFGITQKIADQLFEAGVDVITTGNHVFKQKEIMGHLQKEKRILRPMNYSNPNLPGQGVYVHTLPNGKHFIVLHAMARLFMADQLDCPFHAVDKVLAGLDMSKREIAGVMLDFHGEATSEKMAMGQYLDGRVSFVVGTHTHIPTADTQVLPKGTAYQTDAGMCGDYDSVIGMEKRVPISRFLGNVVTERMHPAAGEGTVCGAMVTLDVTSGLATDIQQVRIGGRLSQSV